MTSQTTANILDPIHPELSPLVFDDPADPEPRVKAVHRKWIVSSIYRALDEGGYEGMENWLSLVFTGSLTTYQYSDESDVDVSLFVDVDHFPEWSRAEMVGLMIEKMDGTQLPGTPYPMQCFVVPPEVTRADLYKPGLRSGYDLDNEAWIVPPERERVRDVEAEMSASYIHALQQADKMANLLKYEPHRAIMFWHQIKRRRRRDMKAGKGDYSDSNITYKMLANRGLFPALSEVSGEYIAKTAADLDVAALALQSTLTNGGITIRVDGTVPTTGYAFSPFKGLEEIIPVAALKEEDIDAFLDKNKQHLVKPQNYLGMWVNGLNTYIDVTQVIEDFDLAYKLAWDADQLAMWDIANAEEIPVREGGLPPLEIASEISHGASRVAVKLPQKQVAKFVYSPLDNHLVIGAMAREEGEVESHADLLRKSGLAPQNNVYGQFDQSGRVETFGRPKIEGYGKAAMSPHEADWRTKQALEQAIPGVRFDTKVVPTHDHWTIDGSPKVTYMHEPPVPSGDISNEPEEWRFAKVASVITPEEALPWEPGHPGKGSWTFSRTANWDNDSRESPYPKGIEPWQPSFLGKGLVSPEGRVYTWQIDENHGTDGYPSHDQVLQALGHSGFAKAIDEKWSFHTIYPDGTHHNLEGPTEHNEIMRAHLPQEARCPGCGEPVQPDDENFFKCDKCKFMGDTEWRPPGEAPTEKDWTYSKTAGSWSVDPRAVDKAATHLGLQHPVEVRVEGGTYGQYQGLQNGTHIIKAVGWLRPQTANEQIWHELVHAKQAENGMKFPDRPEEYDAYRAQPHEQEAHDFKAPFPVILHRGDSNDSDTSRAVPT